MLVVVRKPRTNVTLFKVKGDIPPGVLKYLGREFGQDVEVVEDDEELLNIFDTNWYKDISEATTPGDSLRTYLENFALTQAELGHKPGKFTQQNN